MKFLITGHPRCGTGYMSRLMGSFGYEVGHEEIKRDGISSWMFAVNDDVPYSFDGSSKKDLGLSYYLIHVVRDPIHAIASILYTEDTNESSKEFREKHIFIDKSQNPIYQACQSFIGWNKLIASQRPDMVVKVETAPEILGRCFDKKSEIPASGYNSRAHEPLQWREVRKNTSISLYNELTNFCNKYGYSQS